MDFTVFQQIGVAVALSGLIGIERERKYQLLKYQSFGGIRTLMLIGLMGALGFILSEFSMMFFGVITAGFLGLVIASYVMTSGGSKRSGATSEIASILVYIIGVMSAMEMYVLATSVALGVALILHFKEPLHTWVKQVKSVEIVSAIQFVLIAFVVLPLLPQMGFGPYDFFNPYLIWLMVVLISAISFVSYIAIKLLGARRGIVVTGFLAGMISSTALTLSYSTLSKKAKTVNKPFVVAVVVAGSAMFFRILLEVLIINPDVFRLLALPMFLMGGFGLLTSVYLFRGAGAKEESKKYEKVSTEIGSPFHIIPALKFAVFFALILLFSSYALENFGVNGAYFTAFISGILDVDSVTISMSSLANEGKLTKESAVIAITIAAMTNTFSKGAIFLLFGARKAALKVSMIFLIMIVIGVSTLFLI